MESSSEQPTGLTSWLRKQSMSVRLADGVIIPVRYDSPSDIAGFHWVRNANNVIIKVFENQIIINLPPKEGA